MGLRRGRQTITLASDRLTRGEHRTVDLREHLPCMFEKQSTSARQPHPSFGALQQLNLDLFLQLLDLLTERGLRDVEALRGPPEIQFFSDGNEISQMTQLHAGVPPCQAIAHPNHLPES